MTLIDREAAAKVCEEMPCECCWHDDAKIMADTCAAAIRAMPPVSEPAALAARPDGEATELAEDQIIGAIRDACAGETQWRALTYNSGPYDITRINTFTRQFVKRLAAISAREAPKTTPETDEQDAVKCHFCTGGGKLMHHGQVIDCGICGGTGRITAVVDGCREALTDARRYRAWRDGEVIISFQPQNVSARHRDSDPHDPNSWHVSDTFLKAIDAAMCDAGTQKL